MEERLKMMMKLASNHSPLAAALLEDANTRDKAENTARIYLKDKWDREDQTSYCVWATLWFILGMLATLAVLGTGADLWTMLGL